MGYECVVVNMLCATSYGHAKQVSFGMAAVDVEAVVIACVAVEQRDAIDKHVGTLLLVDVERGHTRGVGRAFLEVVVVESGVGLGYDFNHLRG